MTLINIRRTRPPYAHYVYIGRGSPWGNPYVIGPHGNRAQVIAQFRAWWYAEEQADLRMRAVREISPGSVLGCFCAPQACHGQVIIEFLSRAHGVRSRGGAL